MTKTQKHIVTISGIIGALSMYIVLLTTIIPLGFTMGEVNLMCLIAAVILAAILVATIKYLFQLINKLKIEGDIDNDIKIYHNTSLEEDHEKFNDFLKMSSYLYEEEKR